MSQTNEPGAASDAGSKQDNLEDSGKGAENTETGISQAPKNTATSVYQAPYHHYEEDAVHGEFIVSFRSRHTLADHFAFLGYEFEVISTLYHAYYAALDDQTFTDVRRDPGVSDIRDNVRSEPEWEVIDDPEKSAHQAPHFRAYEWRVPGEYGVAFHPGYTLAEHFAFLRYEFELKGRLNNGYYAALDDQTLYDVRRDLGVMFIEDNTYGVFY